MGRLRNADPMGKLADVIKATTTAQQFPQVGTYTTGGTPYVTLDTGQVVEDPIELLGTPSNGARCLVIWLQGGHDVAVIPAS